MRVLFLTPTLPGGKVSGGLLKSAKLIEFLSKKCDLTVCCLYSDGKTDINWIHNVAVKVMSSRLEPRPRSVTELVKSYFRRLPLALQRNFEQGLQEFLEENWRYFDKIILDHPLLWYALPAGAPYYYHAHNAEFRVYESHIKYAKMSIISRLVLKFEAFRMFKLEREVIEGAELVFASPNDIETFKRSGISRKFSATFHLGEDRIATSNLSFSDRDEAIGIIGSNHWAPNLDGTIWFLEKVWPTLLLRNPGLQLRIIGETTASDQSSFKRIERVTALGYVDDLQSELDKLRCTIVPIRIGAGMKVKTTTSAFSGTPFVSTTHGVAGLDKSVISDVPIFDSASNFAAAIERVVYDEEFWNLQRSVMQRIANNYSWPNTLESFWRAIDES